MKQRWEKPKLVVLTKGRQEEMILTICKSAWPANYINGPLWDFGGYCYSTGTSCTVVCSATSNS
jgi:hypothetical protein